MHNSKLHQWINEAPGGTKAYAQDSLIIDTTEEIWKAMNATNISKAELAKRLGKSRAFVSQILNGSRNMTLRTLADISSVLGRKVSIRLREQHENDAWENISAVIAIRMPLIPTRELEVSNDPAWQDLHEIAETRVA